MDSLAWNERYGAEDFVWTTAPNQFLVREVGPLPAGRALDVACGEGRNAVWLAQQGWKSVGVDFSSTGLTKAKRLAESLGIGVEWLVADIRAWQPEPLAFDLVVLAYVHLPPEERTPMHRSMAAAVAPGGIFFLVAHHLANLNGGYGGPQDPKLLVTPDAIIDDLDGLGLEVVRATREHRSVHSNDGDKTATDALVVLRRPLEV